MKFKKIAIFSLLLFSLKSLAQTNKGTIYIGAESNSLFSSNSSFIKLNDSDEKLNENDFINFNISPQIGYFIIDGLMIGAKIEYTYGNAKSDFSESSSNTILAGPTIRYYFLKSKIRPFVNGTYTYSFFKNEATIHTGNVNDLKQRIYNFDLGIGASFFFSKNISLDLVLNYSKNISKNLDNNNEVEFSRTTNKFISSLGFSIFL